MEKVLVLDKLCSVMNYSAIDHEFNGNEPTLHIKQGILKQKHTENKVIYFSVDENVITSGSQELNPLCLLGAMIQYWLIQCSGFIECNYCE